MAFGRKKRERPVQSPAVCVQTGRVAALPDIALPDGLCGRMYESLREAVPLIDAALFKIIRLTGGFRLTCGDAQRERRLARFLREIPVNGTQYGIEAFLSAYLEQLLVYGTAVGEIVAGCSGVCALYNVPLENVELRRGDSPVEVCVCRRELSGESVPVKRPELILLSVLNPTPGKMTGNSILKGLPFVSGVLMKIYNTIGLNWERVGNVRFAVTYKPQGDEVSRAYARERAEQIAREWSSAMKDTGVVRDFVSVGDVSVRVIGAEGQIPDSEIPVRQMLEQIVAKLGIPPFMLGLTWSSTERMSEQQADVLTSELEAYRRILTPVIERIGNAALTQLGGGRCTAQWEEITLQDEVEHAKARLYHAQAQRLEKENENLTDGGEENGSQIGGDGAGAAETGDPDGRGA